MFTLFLGTLIAGPIGFIAGIGLTLVALKLGPALYKG